MVGRLTAKKRMPAGDSMTAVHTGNAKPPIAQEASAAYLAIFQPLAKERCFIDTNVLVYADSGDEPVKQRIALTLLNQLRLNQKGVLSTQVLTEYCNVALNKLKLPHADIREQMQFWQQYEVVQVTPDIIHAGLDLHQTRSIGYFDALIVAAAKTSGCTVLYSEDMNAGEMVNGVRIVNPFRV
jgi:predicted nucleic acid-binding protein